MGVSVVLGRVEGYRDGDEIGGRVGLGIVIVAKLRSKEESKSKKIAAIGSLKIVAGFS